MELRQQILKKIDEAIAELGMTDYKVSMLATGNKDTLRSIRRGSHPRIDTLEAICNVLDLHVEVRHASEAVSEALDQATGYSKDFPAKVFQQVVERSKPHPADEADYINLPLLDVKAAAGSGTVVEHEIVQNQLYFRKDWLQKQGLFPRNLSLIEAKGGSMEPEISDGDALLIDRGDRIPRTGRTMVAFLEDHLIVKKLSKSNGTWIMASNQLEFGVTILDDPNSIIGRVVWRGGKIK